jgi:hypothetical protein
MNYIFCKGLLHFQKQLNFYAIKFKFPKILYRHSSFAQVPRSLILGIETSCDDTGCAIVDNEGNILGEALKCKFI